MTNLELGKSDTHQALLIGVRPIKQKTREEELEEVVRAALNYGIGCDLTYRAKALLERK